MKKKSVILLVLTIFTCGLLFGCGSGTDTDDTAKAENPNALGDYEVKINDYNLTKDYEGKDAINIEFSFKNNSDEAAEFMSAVMVKVYQDGVEQDMAITEDSDDNSMKSIKTGKSIKVKQAYLLSDKKTDVEVEVTQFLGDDDQKVTKTFKIK